MISGLNRRLGVSLPVICAVLLVVSSLFAVFRIYLESGVPYTHDGENHLARFANYKIAVREGQFPPRWAPNLLNRYGYPVFNYNYPLANILSLPLSIAKVPYEFTFKILMFGSVVFGGLGVWMWLQLSKQSPVTAAAVLAAYSTSNYLVNIVFYRGNIGELMAYALLPWLFYIIDHYKANKTLLGYGAVLIWAAFFLSHNITVLLGVPLYWIYSLLRKKSWREYRDLGLQFLAGFGLAAWFWIPAYFEKSATVLDSASNNSSVQSYLSTVSQLLFSPTEFGFLYQGAIDTLSTRFDGVLLGCLVLGLCMIFVRKRYRTNYFIGTIVLVLLLLVLQLSALAQVWNIIPFAGYVQFPMRLSLGATVLTLPIVVQVLSQLSVRLKTVVLFLLCVQIIGVFSLRVADRVDRTNIDYDAFTQSTSTQNENRARGFEYSDIGDWQPTAQVLRGAGSVAVEYWTGSSRQYTLELTEESVVVEPTMQFLGWQTKYVNNDHSQQLSYIDDAEIAGRLAYRLPAGSYQVTTQFTQYTQARIIGNSISLVTLISLVLLTGKSLWGRKRSHV